jgi:hypothetical protein
VVQGTTEACPLSLDLQSQSMCIADIVVLNDWKGKTRMRVRHCDLWRWDYNILFVCLADDRERSRSRPSFVVGTNGVQCKPPMNEVKQTALFLLQALHPAAGITA